MSKKDETPQDNFMLVVNAHDSVEVEPDRHLIIQLDNSIRDAVQAVESTGKKASITLKINVSREAQGRVVFSPSVQTSIPRHPMSSVALWTKGGGTLSTTNPKQETLNFPKLKPARANAEEEN